MEIYFRITLFFGLLGLCLNKCYGEINVSGPSECFGKKEEITLFDRDSVCCYNEVSYLGITVKQCTPMPLNYALKGSKAIEEELTKITSQLQLGAEIKNIDCGQYPTSSNVAIPSSVSLLNNCAAYLNYYQPNKAFDCNYFSGYGSKCCYVSLNVNSQEVKLCHSVDNTRFNSTSLDVNSYFKIATSEYGATLNKYECFGFYVKFNVLLLLVLFLFL